LQQPCYRLVSRTSWDNTLVSHSQITHSYQPVRQVTHEHAAINLGKFCDWLHVKGRLIQKGQFVPTAGEGIRLRRLRMVNEIQCTIPFITRYQCNTVHSKTLQVHKRDSRLSNCTTYLLNAYYYVSAFANTKPDPTDQIWLNVTRCGCSLTSCTLANLLTGIHFYNNSLKILRAVASCGGQQYIKLTMYS